MEPDAICADAIGPPARVLYMPTLQRMSGRLLVEARGAPVGVIEVADGYVRIGPVSKAADALLVVSERADLWRLLAGEIHPVLASIQGRLAAYGNLEFAMRVMLALNARST